MEVDNQSNEELENSFDAICADVPAGKLHWIDSDESVQKPVASYARLFDITAIGMHETFDKLGKSHIEIYPDRVTIESGRSVMFLPAEYRGSVCNNKAVVAWDGGRPAARALENAMQNLETEVSVEIVYVGRSPLSGSLPGLNVEMLLDRHDVNVSIEELARTRKTIAGTLVNYCETAGAGLVIMGAYEHSPLREGLIGGGAHDIALHAKTPVLMSH